MTRKPEQVAMPESIARLPRDHRGYPIPFVQFVDGEGIDWSTLDEQQQRRCWRDRLCGVCGEKLDYWLAFLGGPKSVAARLFDDPPMHEACARYSLAACAFLRGATNGKVRRPERMAIYVTRQFEVVALPDHADQPTGHLSAYAAPAKRIEWVPA